MKFEDKLFIHKYQPIYFDDFGKNNEVIDILKAFILMDNLNLLLLGNIASGKTSLLNAIIKEYYKDYEPKEYEENVLFINSLKEQGNNQYRTDVKTFCQTCSTIQNKKKFVILDDIDYINEQSQQVFRNCIDKFSHNVHFISSCSNIQKVIENLQSRLSIIKIKPLQKENLIEIIKNIKECEQLDIEPEAEEFIINVCNNTVKILINYMEKFKLLGEKITLDLAVKLCSNISFYTLEDYTKMVKEKNLDESLNLIYDLFDRGYSVMDILDNYFIFIKYTDILTEDEKYIVIQCICKYIKIFYNIHEDEIELSLFTNNLINILHNS